MNKKEELTQMIADIYEYIETLENIREHIRFVEEARIDSDGLKIKLKELETEFKNL